MKKIVIIAFFIPYFLAVMSILIVLFAGLTVQHISADGLPYITNPVTSITGVEA